MSGFTPYIKPPYEFSNMFIQHEFRMKEDKMRANKILIGIDLQEDFFRGSLKNQFAIDAIPYIKAKIEKYVNNQDSILLTQDTHGLNYLDTQEGQNLPVIHTQQGQPGHEFLFEIRETIKYWKVEIFEKSTFGSLSMCNYLKISNSANTIHEIVLIGVVSSICVISNALLIKAYLPEVKITVDAKCCAGLSKEDHNAAMIVMEMCQINVINFDEGE